MPDDRALAERVFSRAVGATASPDEQLADQVFSRVESSAPPPQIELPQQAAPTSLTRTAGRIALETGGAIGGGLLGGAVGSFAGPLGTGAGILGGRAAGGALGSLIAETFDKTESPGTTAGIAGAFGMIGPMGGPGKGLRLKDLGEDVVGYLRSRNTLPPPGMILKSPKLEALQGIAENSMLSGGKIQALKEGVVGVAEEDLSQYIKDIGKYTVAEKALYNALDQGGIAAARPNVSAVLRGMEALQQRFVDFPAGLAEQMSKLRTKLAADPTLAWADAKDLRSTLLSLARSSDNAQTQGALYKLAGGLDTSMESAAQKLGGNLYDTWRLANDLHKTRMQGEYMNEVLLKAADPGTMQLRGSQIVNAMKSATAEHELPEAMRANVMRLGQVLTLAEKRGNQGALGLVARGAEAGGLIGVMTGGAGAASGMAGGAMLGGAGAILGLAPSALAYVLSNPVTINLLIRLAQAGPGTRAAGRAATQLAATMAENGLYPPERLPQNIQGEYFGGPTVAGRITPPPPPETP